MVNQIPSLYKNNPLTTKNKRISMVNIINNKKNNLVNNNSHINKRKEKDKRKAKRKPKTKSRR